MKFERRREIALTNLILAIDDSCSAAVITLREPAEVWKKLKQMYETVSGTRIDAYLAQLHGVKMLQREKVWNMSIY